MNILLVELNVTDTTQVTTIDLLSLYWKVSRCWANHALSISENMSVERALHILREVRDLADKLGQKRLTLMAHTLLWAIVVGQSEPVDLEPLPDPEQRSKAALKLLVDKGVLVA